MAHLILTSYWILPHFLTHDSSIKKPDQKRRKLKGGNTAYIAGTVETESDIQVINNDEGPATKSQS